jgi:acetyl esterase/lipase
MPSEVIPLWPGKVPDARGTDPVKDVPTLSLFFPPPNTATGAAIVICPGGAYAFLADNEGKDYALWLNQHGIAGFVLKYRLGSAGYRYPVMLNDVQRAIRIVRFRASEWKLNPAKIGVMGSSAGGHLASTALTHFDLGDQDATDPIDRVSSRPDLGILCYAVITMGPHTHAGSKANLLGKDPSPELVQLLSNELHVTRQTPPCFLWHGADDHVVVMQNSMDFANALAQNGVPFELHIYQHGPHGIGVGIRGYDPYTSDPAQLRPWMTEMAIWLKLQKFGR